MKTYREPDRRNTRAPLDITAEVFSELVTEFPEAFHKLDEKASRSFTNLSKILSQNF